MNIISQNFKNALKNKIKILITPIYYNLIDSIVDNIGNNNFDFSKYFSLFHSVQSSVRDSMRLIIVSTFEEIDAEFKTSLFRKSRYYINKSNVSRTLNTIIGPITFSRTYYKSKFSKKSFFFLDSAFDLPKYDHYDPIVKAIAIQNAVDTSQAQASRYISSFVDDVKFWVDNSSFLNIPRQSIFNWIKSWHVPNIVPKSIHTPETLYVMADEKYIGAQDIDKDIMVKCFVTFEDVKHVSKHRNALSNRFVFSTYSSKPWPQFMDLIAKRYDFSKINNICLLGDGGSWIKSGVNELRIDTNNSVKFYLCEFHFKQAIHNITPDDDERQKLIDIFTTQSKQNFIDAVNEILTNNPHKEQTITKKLNYIINNYTAIKSMLNLNVGSSMESHISHLIASFFSSRPKGFSTKRINKYLKLNDYKNNNINIFNLYLKSYKYKKTMSIDEDYLDFSIFYKDDIHNIPILNYGLVTPIYKDLKAIAH